MAVLILVMVVAQELALKAAPVLALLDAPDVQVIVPVLVVMVVRVALVHAVEDVKINVVHVQDVMDVLVLALEVALDLVQDVIAAQALVKQIVQVVVLIVHKDVATTVQPNVCLVANQIVMLLAVTLVRQFHQV